MNEQRVGKLWIRQDDDGTRRLGGVLLVDVPAGSHVRLRKNHDARSRADGEYLLMLVEPEPKRLAPVASATKQSRNAHDEETIWSFIPPDE